MGRSHAVLEGDINSANLRAGALDMGITQGQYGSRRAQSLHFGADIEIGKQGRQAGCLNNCVGGIALGIDLR